MNRSGGECAVSPRSAPFRPVGVHGPARIAFARLLEAVRRQEDVREERETRASWLFMTPKTVCKLKKPTRTAFFDFTRPDIRRRNCWQEVRLNRRLAPAVYLGTEDISLESGNGVADWMVRMRRLPAAAALDRQIAAGRLDVAKLERVLRRLAYFLTVPLPRGTDPAARLAIIRGGVAANLAILGQGEYALSTRALNAAAARLEEDMERCRTLLWSRVAEGCVVEGHGDLRPEHVYLTDPPVVIDCLEFDRRLRLLDPLEDLALLALEAGLCGASHVGMAAVAAYARLSGDAVPPDLMGFYLRRASLLRARLCVQRLDDRIGEAERSRWRARTVLYLAAAADPHAAEEFTGDASHLRTAALPPAPSGVRAASGH